MAVRLFLLPGEDYRVIVPLYKAGPGARFT